MFERLFKYPRVLARHREGPLAEARERFLAHCANEDMAPGTLLRIARELLVIVGRIDTTAETLITRPQIEVAAHRWARQQRRQGRIGGKLSGSRDLFAQVATRWLRFLGRLEVSSPKPSADTELMEGFAAYMREERGLSPRTIFARGWQVQKFLSWLSEQRRCFAQVRLEDIDEYLNLQGQHGWNRVSVATSAKALRALFRYAEQRGCCAVGIATGIVGPRVFTHEGLPVGPDWNDVRRLLSSASGNAPRDIRDAALLQLFAVYGFRSGEVAKLQLDDMHWAQDLICLRRPKQRCAQEYPLLPSVGEAILRYVQQVRPRSPCREIFLRLHAPFRPLSTGGLYDMVRQRLDALGICSLRRGPHALRHACAGHLLAEGFSLKQIGDHLGHRSAYATRTYAKVDLAALREVAQISLGGLL
ncbi:MAG: tyrosine-type recombinase/integrase [Betaproteobacteria bacterium]|nr:tyrosine-type recombinase/integrase [Betaproteobacteria bacterium]